MTEVYQLQKFLIYLTKEEIKMKLSQKEKALGVLEEACKKVYDEHGTIFTQMLNVNYWIQKQMDKCEKLGNVTRQEIMNILSKFYK